MAEKSPAPQVKGKVAANMVGELAQAIIDLVGEWADHYGIDLVGEDTRAAVQDCLRDLAKTMPTKEEIEADEAAESTPVAKA